jgi:hypothetical protein
VKKRNRISNQNIELESEIATPARQSNSNHITKNPSSKLQTDSLIDDGKDNAKKDSTQDNEHS